MTEGRISRCIKGGAGGLFQDGGVLVWCQGLSPAEKLTVSSDRLEHMSRLWVSSCG